MGYAIAFMYLCVFALAPFIGFAMWMAFDGDRLREPEEQDAAVPAPVGTATAVPASVARAAAGGGDTARTTAA